MAKHGGPVYSKACDLEGDTGILGHYYDVVDALPEALAGQHGIRRWEYAMALRAICEWQAAQPPRTTAPGAIGVPAPLQIGDVGGAGSGFWQLLRGLTTAPITLVDPHAHENPSPGATVLAATTIEAFAAAQPPAQFDILTCISVIEHVEIIPPFLRACHQLLKPGGLLFLTTDFTDEDGPDHFHYHWMRVRIYNLLRFKDLLDQRARPIGFRQFGRIDWTWHGPQVYDYSVASLALVKKEAPGAASS